MKKPIKAILLVILILSILISTVACKEKPNVSIRFFEGNSVVITTDRKAVLIDAAKEDAAKIVKYLTNTNTEIIETAVISELNEETLAGIVEITKKVDAASFYIPAQGYTGAGYEEFMTACDELAIEPYIVDGSVSFGVNDISVRVYAPVDSAKGSLITRVVCNKRSMLFLSNADNDRILEFLEYDKNSYDLIKLPVNGESFNSLKTLFATAKPDIAVISAGADSQSEFIKEFRCKSYITNKALTFTCNGKKITEYRK